MDYRQTIEEIKNRIFVVIDSYIPNDEASQMFQVSSEC